MFILLIVLVGSFSAYAESPSDTDPKTGSLEDITQELKEIIRGGDENAQILLSRNTDPGRVARGAKLYKESCVQCHGEGGIGAPNWHRRDTSGNYPPPPLNGTAHTWHHPKAQLLEMIRNGGVVMPAFSSQLDDKEIEDIIHWFQSLWPDELYQAWARQNEAYKQNVD